MEAKKDILMCLIREGKQMISSISERCGYSIPTTTKYINELIDEGIVACCGKKSDTRGKKPAIYTAKADAKYFIGVDIRRFSLVIATMDLLGNIVYNTAIQDFTFENTPPYFRKMTSAVRDYINESGIDRGRIASVNFNVSGRVDSRRGISHSIFCFEGDDTPLAEILTDEIGLPAIIENDTRAMTVGELLRFSGKNFSNFLLVNISSGIGLGIVINGKIFGGTNGYAGELGHTNIFNNEIICHCGKKGCLETEISGVAANRILSARILGGETSILGEKVRSRQEITPDDLVNAVNREDPLAIDVIESMGGKLGRELANLINIFNPEAIILSGSLSKEKTYFVESVKSGIRKYSLRVIYRNVSILTSEDPDRLGVIGACLIGREKFASEV